MKQDNRIKLYTDTLPSVSLCGYIETDTGFVHPDRVLDVNVLLYVEEGSFHVFEEKEAFTVEAGELVFLKQGLHHYGDIKCPKGTKWFFVHFNLKEKEEATELLPFEHFLYTEGTGGGRSAYRVLPKTLHIDKNSRIFSKFMTFNKMFESRNYNDNLNLNAYLYGILTDIYEASIKDKHVDVNREKAFKMMEYLDANADKPFDSAGLEELMGLTFKHLNLIFKKTTGTTLWKYHSGVRCEKAKRLLASTSMSIGEISESLSFESPYYFCNSFKRLVGVSPSKYRKENLI